MDRISPSLEPWLTCAEGARGERWEEVAFLVVNSNECSGPLTLPALSPSALAAEAAEAAESATACGSDVGLGSDTAVAFGSLFSEESASSRATWSTTSGFLAGQAGKLAGETGAGPGGMIWRPDAPPPALPAAVCHAARAADSRG